MNPGSVIKQKIAIGITEPLIFERLDNPRTHLFDLVFPVRLGARFYHFRYGLGHVCPKNGERFRGPARPFIKGHELFVDQKNQSQRVLTKSHQGMVGRVNRTPAKAPFVVVLAGPGRGQTSGSDFFKANVLRIIGLDFISNVRKLTQGVMKYLAVGTGRQIGLGDGEPFVISLRGLWQSNKRSVKIPGIKRP
jgi:hypothetical protein